MPLQRRGAAVEITGLRREYVSGQGSVVAIERVDLRVAAGRCDGPRDGHVASASAIS